MLAISAKNTVKLSLVQVAVTVFGVLAAGTSQKVAAVCFGHIEVFSLDLLMDAALALLFMPLIWITAMSAVGARNTVSDEAKQSFFTLGFVLLVVLLVLAAYASIRPWTMPVAPNGRHAGRGAQEVRSRNELQLLSSTSQPRYAGVSAMV